MAAWDFDAAYRTYSRMVYWTAYGILRSESDAMDVSQETFLRALRHARQLAGMNERQCKSWFYRVAVNLCMDQKRRSKREFPSEEETVYEGPVTDEAVLPEPAALNKEQRALLREAVDGLPDVYRQTVTLHYFSRLGYEEIAELQGVSEGTIKSRMSRAKAKLYEALEKGGALRG